MRIAIINKFFYRRGGSESAFFSTIQLLEGKGHRVIPFAMRHPMNEESPYSSYFVSEVDLRGRNSIWGKLSTASRIIYSTEARRKLSNLLARELVNIAHLHNIHHQLSPSIIVELKSRNIPIVMTLHDYKMVCPTYSLLDAKGICEQCSGGRYWHVLAASCGQGFSERAILALEMYLHHKIFRFYELVDVFISPSQFLKEKLWQMGFKGEVHVLPNFIDSKLNNVNSGYCQGIVYFGRLSQEKGLYTLLKSAKALPYDIRIIGEGPLRQELEKIAIANQLSNVHFLGYLSGKDLAREIASAQVVVVPSEWYENNPFSVIEAFAFGKPVIGSRIGGIPELVRDGDTGLTFEPGNVDDLRKKIEYLCERPDMAITMGRRARALVENELNPDKHYKGLIDIYQRAIEKAKPRSRITT